MLSRLSLLFTIALAGVLSCQATPTLYLVGDSTVRNSSAGQMGWGDPLVDEFDSRKIIVVNRAIGGRSGRTFLNEGRWDAVMANLKPGDFVLIQFGHNESGRLNDDRCRASLRGIGEESEPIVRKTDQQSETVQTYGWYLRKFIRDAKSVKATPIVVSLIPRNLWTDDRISRSDNSYGGWAKQVAEQEKTPFIDFNNLLADRFEILGREKTREFFAGDDHTHTCEKGAGFNARVMAEAIRGLRLKGLSDSLYPSGLWLPSVFSDHMVLQRDLPVPVWGTATPGAEIKASLDGKTTTAVADDRGRWSLQLPEFSAGGPFELVVSSGKARFTFQDVLIGEVWLCSGQSNMDFTLAKTDKRAFAGVTDWKNEVAAADHPMIRMFTADWKMSEFPQRDVPGKWQVCSPRTAGDFSAVAYYFGRNIQKDLGVPVGLLTCAYGASTIEAWIRQDALATHPQFKNLMRAYSMKSIKFRDDPRIFADYGKAMAKLKSGRKPPRHPDPVQDQHNPCVLHNGMIAPIAPYGIRGALWYQGESNLNTRHLYTDLQKTLIEDWRKQWGNPQMPFYLVQLAAYQAPSAVPGSGELPEMRDQQAKSLTIPNTGMVVTIDIGDEKDVHPRNKKDVGHRLARLALVQTYRKEGMASGPLYRESSIQGNRILIHFNHAENGLISKNGPLKHFAIASADRKFVWANAVIDGDSVIVSSPEIQNPAHVRYAWADHPEGANLYNSDGLPAAPFRTDP
jgi:sialate O-acetylesterase